MTPEAWDLWIKGVSLALSLAAMAVAVWRTRRQDVDGRLDVTGRRVDEMRDATYERLARHDRRIQAVEQTVQGLPARADIHAIQLDLARMSGALEAISASMDGHREIMKRLEKIVDRHENHLMTGGDRR